MNDTTFPWLTTLVVLPLVGAAAVWLLPASARRRARPVAVGVSLVTLVVGVLALGVFDVADAGTVQLTERVGWIPAFGVSYALGVNGLGLSLILLALFLVPLVLLAAWHEHQAVDGVEVVDDDGRRIRNYVALVLVLEAFMVAVFAARDVFLFYVLFEAMLIPVYFMIGVFGGLQRRYAAVKFLIYSLVGGLVMLVGVIALYLQGPGGPDGFLIDNLVGAQMRPLTERLLFLSFFFAFAIKAPMWPVHTWLPDAAERPPAGPTVLLVGVLARVGAIGQEDLMRLIAYTAVSHFGFIVLGIFAFTSVSIQGASLYMLTHGLSTGALFLVAGFLVRRWGTARIGDLGGLQKVVPVLAGTFLVAGLSALSLPGLAPFVSELLVFVGTFAAHKAVAVVATLGVVLAALYVLLAYQRIFTGPVRGSLSTQRDLSVRERWVIGPLVAALLVLGFVPGLADQVEREPATVTQSSVGVTDPAPLVSEAVPAQTTDGSDQ